MKPFDAIGVVEACYDLEPDAEQWLHALARAAHRGLSGVLTVAILYEMGKNGRADYAGLVGTDDPRNLEEVRHHVALASQMAADDGVRHLMQQARKRTAWSFSETMAPLGPEHVGWLEENVLWPGRPIIDFLGACAWLENDQVVLFEGLAERRLRPATSQRFAWSRILPHVEAGARLRSRIDRLPEAVLTADGRCEHLEGPARARSSRERLREAVRIRERARGPMRRRDPEQALELWKGLVAGRWSLVDRFESDGRRYVVALRNPPTRTDPRALSERERQVAYLVAQGSSNKLAAYTLGLSESTVGTHLARALRKLGLHRREELARELLPMELTTIHAGDTVLAVGHSHLTAPMDGLTDAEREVVRGVLRGLPDRAIAAERASAPRTVANQLQSIYRKLGVASRAELVRLVAGRSPPAPDA